MSEEWNNLMSKIEAVWHYDSSGELDVEAIVDVLIEEIDDLEKRMDALEQSEEINANRRGQMTTAERCREDNERI